MSAAAYPARAGALWAGTPRRRHQWQAMVYREDPRGRVVLWRGEIRDKAEEAQALAEAELRSNAKTYA